MQLNFQQNIFAQNRVVMKYICILNYPADRNLFLVPINNYLASNHLYRVCYPFLNIQIRGKYYTFVNKHDRDSDLWFGFMIQIDVFICVFCLVNECSSVHFKCHWCGKWSRDEKFSPGARKFPVIPAIVQDWEY